MKASLLSLLLAAVLHAQPLSQPEGWPVTTIFPDIPTIKESQVPDSLYCGDAVVRKDGQIFSLHRSTFKRDDPPNNVAKGYAAIKNLILSRGAVMEKEEDIQILGLDGKRFVFTYMKGERTVDTRSIYIGNEYYQFSFERDTRNDPSKEAEDFLGKAQLAANRAAKPKP